MHYNNFIFLSAFTNVGCAEPVRENGENLPCPRRSSSISGVYHLTTLQLDGHFSFLYYLSLETSTKSSRLAGKVVRDMTRVPAAINNEVDVCFRLHGCLLAFSTHVSVTHTGMDHGSTYRQLSIDKLVHSTTLAPVVNFSLSCQHLERP